MAKIPVLKTNDFYYYYQLPNGLKVYLMERPLFQTTQGILVVKYGSNDLSFEVDQEAKVKDFPEGIAHFLEHKMFETANGPSPDQLFGEYGADYNAYTSYEETAYVFSTTEAVTECTQILLDFVQKASFTTEGIEKEREIIELELKMYLDNYQENYRQATLESLYVNHPIRNDIGGTISSIKKITKQDLKTCYNTFYQPNNMILAVVGNFDQEKLIEAIIENQAKKRFKPSQTRPIVRHKVDEPLEVNRKEFTLIKDVFVATSKIAIKLPYRNLTSQEINKVEFGLRFFLHYSFSKIYPFYQALIKDQIISKSIFRDVYLGSDYGYLEISSTTDQYQAFEERVIKQLKSLATVKIKPEELELFKKMTIANIIKGFDSNLTWCEEILNNAIEGGELATILKDIEEINLDDLKKIQPVFDERYFTVVRMLPRNISRGNR